MSNVRTPGRSIGRYFPFSVSGAALLALALALLAGSLLSRDPYELVLAAFALLILGSLAALSRMQAQQLEKYPIQWDSANPLVAGREPAEQRVTGIEIKPLLGFRLHFTVAGRLQVGNGASLYLVQTTVASRASGGALPVRLAFPLCGVFACHGVLSIGDIFGLTRSRAGEPFARRLAVCPGPHPESVSVRIDATERSEEKQSQLNSDEDKYYMREYAPGDRFRDINWKTSSRLAQLITRIAPVAQERTKIITVELRNYRAEAPETLDSVAHLSYLKGWLLAFLRQAKASNPDFQFLVATGSGTSRLSSVEDIDAFAQVLSEIHYRSEAPIAQAPTDEIYVFTTPFDRELPAMLQAFPQAKITVFRTLPGDWPAGARRRKVALFRFRDQLPLPGPWAFRREARSSVPGLEATRARVAAQDSLRVGLIDFGE